MAHHQLMAKRQAAKPQQPPARARAAGEPDPGSASVLPMEIQIGDRFTDQGEEWEVLTHPAAMHGGKSLRPASSALESQRLGAR
jgi:hypothetical protein